MPLHVSSTCAHHQDVKIALHSLLYHHTYRCDDILYMHVYIEYAGKLCSDLFTSTFSVLPNVHPQYHYQAHHAIDQTTYMVAGNKYQKLQVQVFLRMSNWMCETFRRHNS